MYKREHLFARHCADYAAKYGIHIAPHTWKVLRRLFVRDFLEGYIGTGELFRQAHGVILENALHVAYPAHYPNHTVEHVYY